MLCRGQYKNWQRLAAMFGITNLTVAGRPFNRLTRDNCVL